MIVYIEVGDCVYYEFTEVWIDEVIDENTIKCNDGYGSEYTLSTNLLGIPKLVSDCVIKAKK